MRGEESAAPVAATGPVPAAAASRVAQAFSSLAVVNSRFLLGGTVGSSLAMWMEQIGQRWLVAQLTNSAFDQTLLQLHVADEYRGRVLSLYTMSQGLNPLGALVLGFVASEFLGTAHAIAAFCIVAPVLAAASGVASKEIRSL